MTNSHNHLGNNNPLADNLFNPLAPELGDENVDLGITNREYSYTELINSESEELSLIEELMKAQSQDDDDYEGSLFNNRPRSFSFNYNNYSDGSYTGRDEDDFRVNQDATNSQADDFGSNIVAQGTGLTGEYFDQANLSKSILTRTDTNIDFDWKKGSPDPAIKKNTFSVRWKGQIEATQSETYTFYTQADDGVRLWVNQELIIDDWKQHSRQERSGTIDLEAGEFYDIKLEYFEKKGSASVSLLWSSLSQDKEIIPTSFLYPEGYVPPVTPPTDSAITAPGESTEQVTTTLSLVSKGGDFNNEAGLFLVDDETGRIGNLNPGDEGYAAAALAPERRLLVLRSSQQETETNIPGGSYVGSYLIQNNTTEAFLAHNPHNNLDSHPVAFFNFTSTNPDNFDHLETSSGGENSINLAWEDLKGGGDKDFDDLIVNLDFAIASYPPLVQPSNLDFSIVAEGKVRVNGSSDFDGDPADYSDDALIYAGKGFTFNGNLELPVVRDEAGNAITNGENKQVLVDRAVAVSSNYLHANVNGNNNNRYSGLVPPQIVDAQTVIVPEYQSVLDEILANTIPVAQGEINFNIRHNRMNNQNQWQQKFPVPGTADNPTVVRVTGGGLNIPSHVDLSNYVIIVEQGSINFNGNGQDLDNVVLVAENGHVNLGKVQAHNSSIFACHAINMNGQARFSGETLIANSQGNITFDGATSTTEESDRLTVIAAGDITFNGSSDTRGEFLTAKNFTFNGHSTLYGLIGAKQNITFNGNGTVIGISNPDANPTPEVTIDDITVVEGDMGTKLAQFNVTLSNPSNVVVTVDYGTEDSTATEGIDYGATSGTVTFEPGETTQTIQVPIIGDSLDELDKEFLVNLSNPSNANIVDDSGKGTIEDNDDAPALSISSELVTEGDTAIKQAEFTVMLSNPSGQEISVDFNTVEGTATAGIDYTAIAGTLTFTPGEIAKTITVDILGDNLDEVDEAFSIQLANPNNVTISNNLATGMIIDNDLPPEITIENVEVTEGDEGPNKATITINLDRPSSLPVSVDYFTANDTAIGGEDYNAIAGTLTFAPGEISKTIEIAIAGDTRDEFDETLAINLTNASNGSIANNTGSVKILDNDNPPLVAVEDITVTEGTNGTSTAIFTVSLDNPSSKEITLDYATADGTAISGQDYIATNGTLTFVPGETTKAIAVTIQGDKLDELDEAFTLNFTNPSNVTLVDTQGTVTITDDDNGPEITLTDITVTEVDNGNTTATVTVTLSNPSSLPITVDYATADGTAIAGEDYITQNGTIAFAPGETTKTIEIAVTGDILDELDEAFSVNLTNPSNVTLTQSQSNVTIIDNDLAPQIAIDDISVIEGNSGTSIATFTVTLDHASSQIVTVDYATANNTATVGEDLTAANGTVTFNPGETTKTISVVVIGDSIDELDESFNVNLTNPSNGIITDGEGRATIVNDDVTPELSVADISVVEGNDGTSTAVFTINLNNPSSKEITLDYATTDGTAIAGIDYQAIAGTLIFAPGEITKTIEVEVNGDNLDEIDEAFTLNFDNENNVTLNNSQATATITDDDLHPEVAIDDITVTEGDNGNTTASFTVTLNNPSSKEITVDYSTLDGTALAGEDYKAIAGTLTFAPGETTKTITVDVIGDNIDEIDEAFALSLNNASNALVVQSPGTATIADDDLPPALFVDDVVITETDEGTTNAVFTITLPNPSSKSITVDYATTDGTAIAGKDYTATSGTLTFAPGETTKTVSVSIIGDKLDELDKEFSLDLSNAELATVADNYGLGTILDNDLPPEIIVESVTVLEGEIGTKEAQFVINLTVPSDLPITVDYATADGTAIAGEDYLATSGSIFFAPGEISKTVSVSVIGDSLDELDEAFDLNLTNITNATPDSFIATGAIADNDLPPQISIDSVTVEEEDSNPVNTVFTVSLNAPSNLPITVEYSTTDITASAAADGDYLAVNGTITFNPGETSKNIVVPVLGDLINENEETFTVNLANPTNAIFTNSQGTGTIEDNDNSPELLISDATVIEGDDGTTTASFTVNLSKAVASSVSVDYATADGDAIAEADYTATNGTLTFNPGEISKTVEVKIIGDTTDEVDEIFTVNLNNVSSTTEVLIEDGTGTVTIVDNDSLINEPEGILLAEGSDFEVEYIQPLTVPSASSVITIAYSDLNFDTTDPNSINDALEFALVDENGKSLIHTIGSNQTAFFNLTEGEAANLAPGVTLDGETIKVNLTDVIAGTTANLIARLVNNDGDINTSVRIDTMFIESGDETIPVSIPDDVVVVDTLDVVNFDSLQDVTPSVSIQYQQTSYNREKQTLIADLALENQGTYWLDTPLIVAVTNISDPTVRIVGADGITPDSLSYYDFSNLVEDEHPQGDNGANRFAPGASSEAAEIAFYNPNGVQFTYELVVLSELNTAPEIVSNPDLEVIGGQSYSYRVKANDINNDALSYRLLAAPGNMSIDETTGLINWDTTTDDISNHAVVVEVSDGRGGVDLQTFNLEVIATPANRPPQFTSTPVVDAYINQPYNYDANAVDPDGDAIGYELISGPEGLTVDSNTGEVEWTPPSVVVLGDTVIGQISLPGEVDEFSFSGTAGQQIYFDPLQYTGRYQNWNFDVYAPSGEQIVDTDLRYQNNQLVKLPETGNYRVVVSTSSSQTGSYGFSVIDLNLTPIIALDTVIEGELSPGSEDDIYRFVGNKGQKVFIDKISNSSNSVDWVLYDPQNAVTTSNGSMGDLEVPLPADGEYKLAIRGDAGLTSTVDYSFEIITPDEFIAPMELGSIDSPKTVSGEITEKGERDIYTFNGGIGQKLILDRLFLNSTNSSSHTIKIVSPSSNLVTTFNLDSGDETVPIILPESGLYQVQVDATGENTGTYSFSLLDIDLGKKVEFDTQYENTLDPGQEIHLYQFEGIKSQRLFIDSLQSVSGSWELYDSSLKSVKNDDLKNDIELVLERSDTYYLAIFGSSNNSINYKFELITPDTVTEVIEWNKKVSRTLTEKGEQDIFTFDGVAQQRLLIDSLTNNSNNLKFTVISPSGNELYTNTVLNNDKNRHPLTLNETGTYQLIIDGIIELREDYNFRLLDVASATTITSETKVTGTLDPGKSIQFYKFNGSAGERVYFDSQVNSTNTFWSLYDSANQQIGKTQNLSQDWEYELTTDGDYYLILRGENDALVDYDFQIVTTTNNSMPLTLNELSNGIVSKLGERNTYTFEGNLGQTIYFDSVNGDSNILVEIVSPNGTIIWEGKADGDGIPLTLLESGNYKITFDGLGDWTGEYSFTLANSFQELATFTNYAGTILSQETALYSFEGSAGQRLTWESASETSNAQWTLYAPITLPNNTKVIKTINLASDLENVLPIDGTYLLALQNNSHTSIEYGFKVDDVSSSPITSSGLDTVYERTVNTGETVDSYEVLANAGDLIYLDGQIGGSYPRVQMSGPDGSQVFSNVKVIENQVYQLSQTGAYNLEVYGSSSNYRFGLIDLKTGPDIVTDLATNVYLGAKEAKAYQFTGTVGQKLWFNSISGTNSDYSVVIYNASGSKVASSNSNGDIELVTLEANGQYYLVIESSSTTGNTINFELLDTDASIPVNRDTEIAGTFGESGFETTIYSFNGEAGQRIFIDDQASINAGNYYLYDQGGQLVFSEGFNKNHEFVELTVDGNYTLVVSGAGYVNHDYSINLVTSEEKVTSYVIGDTIASEIVQPGDENSYTFAGTFGQQLWFDSLTSSDIQATLYAPSGKSVWSQSAGDDKAITNLEETGTYRLVLDGTNSIIGAYGFRILDIDDAAINIDLDTLVSGNFGDSTRETQIYRFTGREGQPIYFDRTVGYQKNSYSLYNARGTRLESKDLNVDWELELPQDGEYLLVIEGRGYGDNDNNYSLEIVAPDVITIPYNLGEVVETEISKAGEKDYYTFTGTKGQSLILDSLLPTSTGITFELLAPSGRKISNGSLNQDFLQALDETGIYTLAVDGNNATTEAYSFKLDSYQDAAIEIDFEQIINGDFGINNRETKIYTFDGDVDQYLYFDRTQGDKNNSWALYDDNNNLILGKKLDQDFELALPKSGKYRLYLSGNGYDNNNYSFQIVTPELTSTPYSIEDTVITSIDEAGEQDTFFFAGELGQKLLFDSIESFNGIRWQLYSPSGDRIFNPAQGSENIPVLPETGMYSLKVNASGDLTGEYGFRIQDWNTATAIELDKTVSGDFSTRTETDLYQFNVEKDVHLFFDSLIGGQYDGSWELFDSKGTQLSGYNQLNSDFEITIPETGIYTLHLKGSVFSSNDYSFEVSSSNWLSSLLNLDEEVSGAISVKGEQNIYAFEGAIGQKIFFDAIKGASGITSKIYSPQGELIFNGRSNQDSSPLTLTSNGTYQVIFDGSGITTGDYSFNLKNVASADNLELSTSIVGSLDNANGVKLYQFNDTQGTVLDFNLDAASWSGANWKLYDPNNEVVKSPSANEPDFQAALAMNGVYTLAIIGDGTEAGEFSFEVIDITPASIVHTGFNTVYNETLQPEAVNDHTFTANAGTQVYLDSLGSSNSSIRMRLIAPDGSLVFGDTSFGSDIKLTALPQTGEYNLQVYGEHDSTTGSYSYQLLELPQDLADSSTQSLTLGTINDGSLNGLETKVYNFRGKVGQQIVFNGIEGNEVTATLIAPNGSAIFNNDDYESQNSGIQTLKNNGVYHLLIKGETTTIRDYSFQVLDFNFGNSIALNQTIIGSLENGRANKVYSFSGSAGDTVAFDFIRSSQKLNAKLYAPGNQEVLKQTSLNSSLDFVIELPTDGVYSFYIEGGRDSSKVDYSFRTYTLGEKANLITPGTGETLLNSDTRLNLFPVTLKVEDANGATNIQDYSINLLADPKNAAPVIISEPTTQYNIKETVYRYQIDTLDPDNDLVTFSLIDSPSGALVDSDTGELLWFPNNVVVGNSYDFTVEVADGRGGVDRQTFSVEVSQPLGKIQGIVFEDLNANGLPDSSFLQGDQPDVFFVIDVSGSMGRSSVDWLNADLNEVSRQGISALDQELGTILTLAELAIEQGKGNEAQFGIITSGQSAIDMNPFEPGIQVLTTAAADYNNNGILDIREVINGGVGRGGSNTAGIRLAWDLHRSLPGDPNIIFMSDGFIAVNTSVVTAARADGVNIGAFGFTQQGMETMRLIDPDAAYVANFQEITDIFNGFDLRFMSEPIMDGVTVYLDLNNNEVSRLGRDLYSFRFDNLLPGTYTLRQVIPNGYTQTAPITDSFVDTITIEGSETFSHFFGNHKVEPVPNSNPVFTSFLSIDGLEVGEKLIYNPTATDADGDLLEFELTLAPEGMDVDLETGTVIWQPTDEQIGNAKAILRVNDGRGGSEIQYFELDVIKPNQAPVFTSALTENNKPQIGKPFQYQAVAVDADLDPVTYELTGNNPSGVTIDSNTGLVTWTPNSNQLGAREITIKAIDDKGEEAIQTLDLNVIEAQSNRIPEITSTPRKLVRIGTNYSYQPIASDADGNPYSFNLLSAPDGMVMDEVGRLVWLPRAAQFGVHNVEIEVTDGQGGTAVQSWEIVATNRASNSLPSITSVPNTKTNIDKLYTYQATATDPDGDLLIWSLDNAPEGMVIDSETGSLSWQPGVDQVGTHTVAVKVMDALGAFVGQEFTLTVTGVNTSPQFVSTPITNGSANLAYAYQASATDPENDELRYGLGVHPSEMTIDSNTGVINWNPPRGGSYEVEVLVFDSQFGSNKQVFTLEIDVEALPPNTAPTITSSPSYIADTDTDYSYQVVGEDKEGDVLSYELIAAPSGMTIDSATGEISWTNPLIGQHQIVIGVGDGQANVAQGYTLTVKQNQAPVVNFSSPPADTVLLGESYSYDVAAYDQDEDRLFYSLDPISTEKGMTIDEFGRLRWTPETSNAGNHPVTITITDEAGAEIEQSFTVEVVADTEAPKIDLYPGNIFVVDGEYQTDINSTVTFQAWATDNVGVTGVQLLVNGVPVAVDRDGVADVTFDELGTVELKAIALDAAGNIGEATATVDVYDFSDVDAPTVDIDLSGIEDNIVTAPVDIIGTIDDDNLDYYVLEIAPADGEGEFVELFRSSTPVTDGVIATFDPSTVANDAYSLRVTAFDNGGNFASSEETVYVEGELKLGNFQLSFTDLTVPVAGIPISVTRTYDTLTAGSQDDFGYGWRLEFRDTNLRTSVGEDENFEIFDITSKGFREGDAVYITLPGGKRETFLFKPQLTDVGRMLAALGGGSGLGATGQDFGLYEPIFESESDSNNKLTVIGNKLSLKARCQG